MLGSIRFRVREMNPLIYLSCAVAGSLQASGGKHFPHSVYQMYCARPLFSL